MDSKGLEMPVSESEKLGASVLRCRFSEKAEHLPIKKRRFLFKASSPPPPSPSPSPPPPPQPPLDTESSKETEKLAPFIHSSTQKIHPKPNASLPPPTSSPITQFHQTSIIDSKAEVAKFMEASRKAGEIENSRKSLVAAPSSCSNGLGGILSHGIKSLKTPTAVKLEANVSKETDLHISTAPFKDVASTTNISSSKAPLESQSSKMNQETIKTHNSAPLDDRLNWDLNTVMDSWEEPLEHEQPQVSVSQNINNELLVKSLAHKINEEERKPINNVLSQCKPINNVLSPVLFSAPQVSAFDKIKALQNQVVFSSSMGPTPTSVPSIVKSEYPPCGISSKSSKDVSFPMATGLSLDYSLPSGFNHSKNTLPSEDNILSANHSITKETVNDKLNLSLVTTPCTQNKVHQSTSSLEKVVDDKSQVKRAITMENMIGKATENSQKALNQTTIGSLLVMQSSFLSEAKNQSVVAPEVQVPIKTEETTVTEETSVKQSETINQVSHENSQTDVVNNKNVCEAPLDNNENPPSDIQAGSEVDNVVEEFSVCYESQFEDGEVRELSIQTWEGSNEEEEEEDKEDEHITSLPMDTFAPLEKGSNCEPEPETENSQKGAEEISSIVLPEKPESSDQVSGSEPNSTRELNESDQWKMNVCGSDVAPENQSSVNSGGNMRDLTSLKDEGPRFYRRDSLPFIDRGRFRMQGSSSSNGDDTGFRSVRRGGKYSPHPHGGGRGGATWNRSPVRDRDRDANVNVNNPAYAGPPNEGGQSFRNRMLANRDEEEFRARLGLRPSTEINNNNNRFVNVGRGRSLRYGSRHNGGGPRGRYYGPPNDEYGELEYSHSLPSRRRCFSPPVERREINNHPYHSGSTSPISRTRSPISDGFRRRSRSPNMTRIRRLRSPEFRDGGYNDNIESRNNNNSPPGTRWVKYKQRTSVFDRRSPPPPPPGKIEPSIGERLTFYDSSRKPKPNENYRRFSDVHGGGGGPRFDGGENRRGGFVRRYDMGMGRPVKHIRYDDEEDGYGPPPPVYDSRDKQVLEFHARGNPKVYNNSGNDNRFRELPRRPREERENW